MKPVYPDCDKTSRFHVTYQMSTGNSNPHHHFAWRYDDNRDIG